MIRSWLLRPVLDCLGHLHDHLLTIEHNTIRNLEADMATNAELNVIKAHLVEASTEIPAKLDELLAQVGDQADPALVEEIKGLAANLANIVPNVVGDPGDNGEDDGSEVPADGDEDAPADETEQTP